MSLKGSQTGITSECRQCVCVYSMCVSLFVTLHTCLTMPQLFRMVDASLSLYLSIALSLLIALAPFCMWRVVGTADKSCCRPTSARWCDWCAYVWRDRFNRQSLCVPTRWLTSPHSSELILNHSKRMGLMVRTPALNFDLCTNWRDLVFDLFKKEI